MNWQPISTAPKETALLLATEFFGKGDWRIKCGSFYDGEWHVWGASWTPSHWMPLPAAPGAEPQGVAVDADGERYRWLFGARTAEELAALTADSGPPLDTPQDVVMCELMTNYVTKAYADAMIDSARADQTAAAKESP